MQSKHIKCLVLIFIKHHSNQLVLDCVLLPELKSHIFSTQTCNDEMLRAAQSDDESVIGWIITNVKSTATAANVTDLSVILWRVLRQDVAYNYCFRQNPSYFYHKALALLPPACPDI